MSPGLPGTSPIGQASPRPPCPQRLGGVGQDAVPPRSLGVPVALGGAGSQLRVGAHPPGCLLTCHANLEPSRRLSAQAGAVLPPPGPGWAPLPGTDGRGVSGLRGLYSQARPRLPPQLPHPPCAPRAVPGGGGLPAGGNVLPLPQPPYPPGGLAGSCSETHGGWGPGQEAGLGTGCGMGAPERRFWDEDQIPPAQPRSPWSHPAGYPRPPPPPTSPAPRSQSACPPAHLTCAQSGSWPPFCP